MGHTIKLAPIVGLADGGIVLTLADVAWGAVASAVAAVAVRSVVR